MGVIYKLKPEIVAFIILKKQSNPDLGCRAIAEEVKKKFNIYISKSSVNNILIKEALSSSVGRKAKEHLTLEGKVDHAGFYFLQALNYFLKLTPIATELLVNSVAIPRRIKKLDIENVFDALILYRLLFNSTIDLSICYDKKEIWTVIGRRPSKSNFYDIVHKIKNSQFFVKKLTERLRSELRLVSKIKFLLRDQKVFYIDGLLRSVWPDWFISSNFITTYCNIDSYIESVFRRERPLAIFMSQSTDLFSKENIDFFLSFENYLLEKKISKLELLDYENDVIKSKEIPYNTERLFFLIGFWPWQFYDIGEFNKKVAKEKIEWRNLGLSYYFSREGFHIPQHIAGQIVRLNTIVLKDTPSSPAKLIVLTNMPSEYINEKFLIKELCNWVEAEKRYNDLLIRSKSKNIQIEEIRQLKILDKLNSSNSVEEMCDYLSDLLFSFFRNLFIPSHCFDWNQLKIKDVFLRQKGSVLRTSKFSYCKLFITNKLCEKTDLEYIVDRLNELKIEDSSGRIFWFSVGEEPKI